ncbi:MAG: hypothetical protein WB802_08140 [Candidatus Dormiibacterota bacterium]
MSVSLATWDGAVPTPPGRFERRYGLTGVQVMVEVDVSNGLPGYAAGMLVDDVRIYRAAG